MIKQLYKKSIIVPIFLFCIFLSACNQINVQSDEQNEIESDLTINRDDEGEVAPESDNDSISCDSNENGDSENESDNIVTEENLIEVSDESTESDEREISICREDIIEEKTALDIAYAFYYEGSSMEQYSVFCEIMPTFEPETFTEVQSIFDYSYENASPMGYVVALYSTQNGMEMESYDPSNTIMDKNMTLLLPLGISSNGGFYQFWLCQYIYDGDGMYHFTTLDYLVVSLDGQTIVAERHDMNGEYVDDIEHRNEFYDYLDCEVVISGE